MLAASCAPLYRFTPVAAAYASQTGAPQELARARSPSDRGCPPSASEGAASAIRSPDALLRSLFIDGCRQSPTLHQLAGAIGRTDGVVYMTIGACPFRMLRGCLLHAIEDTGNARYLWIRLSANADVRTTIGLMAHELQHALEVLTRATIRSPRDLLTFYQSTESRAYSANPAAGPYRAYETRAAIDVAAAVLMELANATGALAADDRD